MIAPVLTLMSRKACCLCDEAVREVDELVEQGLCSLEIVDVDQDIRLAALYGMDVPVLLNDAAVIMKHRIDREELRTYLNGDSA
ncbi:MAG: thioredoxin family protein [Zetaproteobacteria bacterium CG_4_9_14_3_um_filter_49_83]|nr:MAG: thioredoxin family protein [Zetaproteobacteria bacterium CG1_02_49_23]PIQ30847.1 MAG: thioredoxin family protein [Zetaproteobacteria bacterium CG17_big_fil_post_rev_8_21_14_2_50_50_13]PIV30747.1 MAG: thioredoxin family protein [Zetaproteobacteria bacterium CG02_land_8_20_14_3_00_50_9]PIY56103.1 MAG: thioredoxin family protein [Zetaproteobacteria bacterium CG_4_10_14_0_8_um_filter_49_80]PJA34543.1 MAG: thioredoxin family protein [Zetaproteobacteria bacterium CG_4_9_14_3_um_filter_49_83]